MNRVCNGCKHLISMSTGKEFCAEFYKFKKDRITKEHIAKCMSGEEKKCRWCEQLTLSDLFKF